MSVISVDLKKKFDEWMSVDPFRHSKDELEKLFKEAEETGNVKVLESRLKKRIAFGTAGLRAKMASGWSCMNDLIIIQTTQGLVKYIEKEIDDCKSRGVIIGVDHRKAGEYSSKRFGELTAAVFLHAGWKVYMYKDLVPTPFVPFGVTYLKCACGIMITASHNPKEDDGYKLYWDNGCQITPPHDEGIQASILQPENYKLWSGLNLSEPEKVWEKCINPVNMFDEYYKSVVQSLKFRSMEKNGESKTKMVYTAVHGVGGPFVERAFAEFGIPSSCLVVTPNQHQPDHTFPGLTKPNPEEAGVLEEAKKVAEKVGSRIVIANDPDADRLAVAELQRDGKTWVKLNGDKIAALFIEWLFDNIATEENKSKLVVINSSVSSKFVSGFADKMGMQYEETLTGFKWIGRKGVELAKDKGYKFLLGYEVEIGFAMGDDCYDKDGVRAASVFYELVDSSYRDGLLLTERLQKLYERIGFYNMITGYFVADNDEKMNIVYKNIREGGYPKTCGRWKVKGVRDLTLGKDTVSGVPNLPSTPDAQMITFRFEDDSVCTLRNSGTEPKVKMYVECKGKTEEEAKKNSVELSKAVIKEFVTPLKVGLEVPEFWNNL